MAEAGRFATWEAGLCPGCEGATFIALVQLQSKAGGGTTTVPAGYQCSQCGKVADMAAMQRAAYLKARKAELAALEAEMGEASPSVAPSATPSGSGSSPSSKR